MELRYTATFSMISVRIFPTPALSASVSCFHRSEGRIWCYCYRSLKVVTTGVSKGRWPSRGCVLVLWTLASSSWMASFQTFGRSREAVGAEKRGEFVNQDPKGDCPLIRCHFCERYVEPLNTSTPFFHGWIPEFHEKARSRWRGETRLREDIFCLENEYSMGLNL